MEKIKKEKRAFKVEKSATSFINVKITHKYPVMSIHSLIHRLIFLVDIVVQRQCHLFPGFAEYIFFILELEKKSLQSWREEKFLIRWRSNSCLDFDFFLIILHIYFIRMIFRDIPFVYSCLIVNCDMQWGGGGSFGVDNISNKKFLARWRSILVVTSIFD